MVKSFNSVEKNSNYFPLKTIPNNNNVGIIFAVLHDILYRVKQPNLNVMLTNFRSYYLDRIGTVSR